MLSSISSFSAAVSLSFQASAVQATATSEAGLNSVSLSSSSASFSLETSFTGSYSRPAVSVPLYDGDHHDHGHHHGHNKVKDDVQDTLSGFMEPFSETAEKLQEIMKTAMELLSELVENSSLDAAAIQIDIRFGRLEESYSGAGGTQSGVFSSFAIEVSVVTADIEFNPDNAAVINMTGAKVELTSEQLIVGHETGVYQREADPMESFPGYNKELAEQTKEIIEFLKENKKMFDDFNKEDRKSIKHMLRDLSHGHRAMNFMT